MDFYVSLRLCSSAAVGFVESPMINLHNQVSGFFAVSKMRHVGQLAKHNMFFILRQF